MVPWPQESLQIDTENQVLALQAVQQETSDIIYITETDTNEEEEQQPNTVFSCNYPCMRCKVDTLLNIPSLCQ